MNKKISLFGLVLVIIFVLNACKPSFLGEIINGSKDKLIGAYISFDYVSLFDLEGYISNTPSFTGGEIKFDKNTEKYEERMYATRKDEVKTASQGEKYTQTEFIFEDVDGISLFAPTITDPLNNDSTYTSFNGGDGSISDLKYDVKSSDNEEGIELEGTIYTSSGSDSSSIYVNPVYQDKDGNVYLTPGQGVSFGGDISDGNVYTQMLTDTATVTINGKCKIYNTSVKVSLAVIDPTEKVTIIQMDKDSNIVKKSDYNPVEVPESFLPEKHTEYIIVESKKTSYDKQTKIERALFSKNDDSIGCFVNNDNNIVIKANSPILWDNTEE